MRHCKEASLISATILDELVNIISEGMTTQEIDDYCLKIYEHTNWGYTSTYSKEELADRSKYDLELDNSIVIWYKGSKEEE